MDFKIRRKRKVSRNERAGKLSSKFRLPNELSRGLLPRLVLVVLFVVCCVLLLPPTQPTKEAIFKAGDIADRDVIAPFNFTVALSQEEIKVARAKASLQAAPVYRRQREIESGLTHDLAALLDTVTSIVNIDTLSADARLNEVGRWLPSLARNTLRVALDPEGFKKINMAAREHQRSVFARGLIDNSAMIRRNGYREISVIDGSREGVRNVADVYDQGRLDQVIREEALARFGNNREKAQLFFELVRGHLVPNLVFDHDETNSRREAQSTTVRDYFDVSKNERIIGKHDKVTKEQEAILRSLEETRASQETARSPLVLLSLYASEVLSLILFALLFGGYLFVFDRRAYRDFASLGAIFAVIVMYVIFISVVVRFDLNSYLVPVAFMSVMTAALFDFRLGMIATVFGAALIPLITPLPPQVAFVSLLAGATGVVGIERMRARSHVYSIFLHVAGAYLIGVFAMEIGQPQSITVIASKASWGVANGLFSSASVIFLLPVFEGLFGRTSRFTLLELTDLNKPLLKRLNMEAHGTYHHSMMIGNLVDAAAEVIGADGLKARVMAYYHDIGKMFKPEYFAENQEAGFNKHEKITPQMSALILVSHVKDGVELAREEKLPPVVIDGIREHHGTSVMAYFYQKSLETDSHSSVNKDDFRYPGPKPQSKETGLLMCADSVEAAVRSLKDHGPVHIRNMVTKLVDLRAQEGELDESGLTLSDLGVIKEKFTSILTGIYHKRIAYPGQDDETPQEQGSEGSASVVKSV